jgi:metallo-beta-lactamase class B
MKAVVIGLFALCSGAAAAEHQQITLSHVRGNVYVVEDDYYLSKENSAVYIGNTFVTVIGATWTPDTARLLASEVAKITQKPIKEVIDTNYNLDRAGGNAYFKSIGAKIISTAMTHDLLQRDWDAMVREARKSYSAYPSSPVTPPDTTFPGDFALQGGRVKGIYLGPSHAPDDIFVYFPEEKVLYGGCILKEQLGNLELANLVEYPKTLRKLKQLDLGYSTIIAGHWSPIHGPELVDQYLRLLALNERQRPGSRHAE